MGAVQPFEVTVITSITYTDMFYKIRIILMDIYYYHNAGPIVDVKLCWHSLISQRYELDINRNTDAFRLNMFSRMIQDIYNRLKFLSVVPLDLFFIKLVIALPEFSL